MANPTTNWATPYTTGGSIFSSPAIAEDGTIYIGSNDNKLHAINSDGSTKWTFSTDDWVDSTPAIGPDGTIYFGSWDNQIYALNPNDGSKIWDFNTSSSIIASPAIGVDGRIYFGSKDEFFYALESNGSLAWEAYVGNAITSSAAIGQDGTIYFGDESGTFHAFNQNGSTKWTYEVDDVTDTNKSILSSPAIDLAGNLYFGSGNGNCYSISDNGSSGILNWKVSTNDRVDTSPVLGLNNEVFFVSRDGYLRSIDTITGITNWDAFTGDVFYSSPVVDKNGRVYVIGYTGFGENHLFAFNHDGTKEWDTNNTSSPLTINGIVDSSLALDSNGNLFFGSFDNKVYSVNVGSGLAESAWPQFRRNNFRTGAWPSFMIQVTASPAGAGQINGGGVYNQGSTATLSVLANSSSGYSFSYWSNGATGSSNPLLLTVDSNLNLVANFGLNIYNLQVSSGIGGTATGSASLTHGSSATITAVPSTGYEFLNWTGEGVSDPNSRITTVQMTEQRTVTANFIPKSYSLSLTNSPFSGGTSTGSGIYQHGDTVSLSADPDTANGYNFSHWSGSLNSNHNPLSFEILTDMNLTANFELNTYSLTVQSSSGGTATGSGIFSHGTTQPVQATPQIGYFFTGWSGEGITESTSSLTSVNMIQNRVVTASFAPIQYSISVTSGEGGSVNEINGLYSHDSNISIQAIADHGYEFSNWSQSGSGISDPNSSTTTLLVDENQSIHANFNPLNFELNMTTTSGGSISSSPMGSSLPFGTVVTLNAIPDTGFYFAGWQGNGISDYNSTSTTVTISENHSIIANFQLIPIGEFILNVNANPTFAAASLSGASVFPGNSIVQISATPNPGYRFENWTGAFVLDENSSITNLTILADTNITANFSLYKHTISVSSSIGGTVNQSTSTLDYGSILSLTATPDTGYSFHKWESNVSISDPLSPNLELQVIEDLNITATFNKISYDLSVELAGNGAVQGGGNYFHGETVNLIASPAIGSTFESWSGNSISNSNDSNLSFFITKDMNITASFSLNSYSFNLTAENGGRVYDFNTTQKFGSNVSIGAAANNGYEFSGWIGNAALDDRFSPFTTVLIEGETSLEASFAPKTFNIILLNEGNGTSSGAGKYNYGTFATLTASPLTGYEFENWSSASGNIDSKSATFSFLVTSDLNITAHFNKIPVSLNEYLQVSEISPSWYSNNWFGFFYQADNGWCYHANFGWIFPESQNDGSLWIWSDQLKWLWLSASSFSESYAFSSEENDWIYFDFTFGNEMYFSVKSDSWILFDKTKKTSSLDSLF